MNCLNNFFFDFLINGVPNVINYYNQVNNSETGAKKYLASMRTCNIYSAAVAIQQYRIQMQNTNKKISISGDKIIAHPHWDETSFDTHFLACAMANDLPRIRPYKNAIAS